MWISEWRPFVILIVFRFELGMMHNPALQPTVNPLRGLSAAELGRYASDEPSSTWVKMMRSDPIVGEMRAHGREFA